VGSFDLPGAGAICKAIAREEIELLAAEVHVSGGAKVIRVATVNGEGTIDALAVFLFEDDVDDAHFPFGVIPRRRVGDYFNAFNQVSLKLPQGVGGTYSREA